MLKIKLILTKYFKSDRIIKNLILKVIKMNLAVMNAGKYFFSFSVVFYFGYVYFAISKLLVRANSSF